MNSDSGSKKQNGARQRDDFSKDVLRVLAERVGHWCSNPECRIQTSGPRADATKSLNLGVGSHITAAAPGGPRYNAELSAEDRKSIKNAIWLCQNCAKLIDNDSERFSVGFLERWKQEAETESLWRVGKKAVSPFQDEEASVAERVTEEESEALASVYVPPVQYEKAKQVVLNRRAVIIAGPPHIGKTATAMHLAREVQRQKQLEGVVLLDAEENLQRWMASSHLVFVLDDCFGATSLSRRELASAFSKFLKRLTKYNYVICTTRMPVLQEAQENTRLGEDNALEQQVVALEQEGSYSDEQLWQILQAHLAWVQSERAEEAERVSPKQAHLALSYARDIVAKLRFPHNIERLCRAHLIEVTDYHSLIRAVELAREIDKAVERWAESLEESERWLVFVTALFGGVRAGVLERIYAHTAQTFGFRAQDVDRLLEKHSAYLGKGSRPTLRHPSYSEAIINLLRRRYNRSVGRVVDRGLFLVLQEDVIAFSRCWHADYGWQRPADFDIYGEEAREARDEAMAEPNVRPFPLNPYLEQLAESYALLRNGLFQGLKPILDPCHCPHNGTFAVLLPRPSSEFGLLLLPSSSDAPAYQVEWVDDLHAKMNEILEEAINAYVPVRAERLYPQDVGQRSPQMHALLLIRRQVEHIFYKQRLPESQPMIQLRMEQVLREFGLHDCVGVPHEWRFHIDWKQPFGVEDFKRVVAHFQKLEQADAPPHLHPEVWERMKSGYACSLVRLGRAFELLEEFGAPYNGPLIPQFDREEWQEWSYGPRFSYTAEGMHQAVQRSLEVILESYKWMVEFSFHPLREQMPGYNSLPFKVVGAVNFTRDTNNWMLTRTLIYILPSDFETQNDQSVELHVHEVSQRDTATLEAHGREQFPPVAQERLRAAAAHGFLRVLSPSPSHFRDPENVIKTIYDWLHDDLNAAMGWSELDGKRNGFLRSMAEQSTPQGYLPAWNMTQFVDPWEMEDWKQ